MEQELQELRAVLATLAEQLRVQNELLAAKDAQIAALTEKIAELTAKLDEKNHKTTYVTLKGLETATADVEVYSNKAIVLLQALEKRNEFLEELIRFLINRDK